MKPRSTRQLVTLTCLAAAWTPTVAATSAQDDEADGPAVRVAALTYGDGRPTRCFAEAFLALADRRSAATVDRRLHAVALEDDRLFDHPMSVIAGDKAFELTEAQADRLGRYLRRGGFVLASANCASKPWDAGFREAIARAVPDAELLPVPIDHPLLHTLFDIDRVSTVKPTEHPLWGVELDGRRAVLYSPVGLSDSAHLKAECCCCGANEIRNARRINANAVIYALTH